MKETSAAAIDRVGDRVADAISAGLHGELLNNQVFSLSDAVYECGRMIANSITPRGVGAGHDENGGTVESLTEAVMGMTAGLCKIANAIESLAESIRELPHA